MAAINTVPIRKLRRVRALTLTGWFETCPESVISPSTGLPSGLSRRVRD
jgi:hypothetical protein